MGSILAVQRPSATEHVPGVQDKETADAAPVPVQLCGPLTVTLPSAAIVPVKPLNGASNVRLQPDCEMRAFWPTRDESQC